MLIASLAEVIELNPDARYIVRMPEYWPLDRCREYEEWLRASGIDAIVVCGEQDWLEIEKDDGTGLGPNKAFPSRSGQPTP